MARCPKCGADNPDYSFYCGKCSSGLRDAAGKIIDPSRGDTAPTGEENPAQQLSAPSTSPPQLIYCCWCGKQVNASTLYCPFCGQNPRGGHGQGYPREGQYSWNQYSQPFAQVRPSHASGTLVLGAIMAILAGALATAQGFLYGVASVELSYVVSGTGPVCLCGGIDVLFGIGSIFAGVYALKRTHFALAVAGAVVGMLGLGFLLGAVFGLIAIICIAVSREEFES